jgi:hypothetical protein
MANLVTLKFNETNYEFQPLNRRNDTQKYQINVNGVPSKLILEVTEKLGYTRSIYTLKNQSKKSVFIEYDDNGLGLSIVSKIINMVERFNKFDNRNK